MTVLPHMIRQRNGLLLWWRRLDQVIQASAFSRNVSVMLFGTVLGQVVSVLLSPVLTRLYTPVEFGTLGVYMSVLNILVGLAAFQYEIPMSTTVEAEAAADMLALCGGLLGLTTALLCLLCWSVPAYWVAAMGLSHLPHVRLLLPLGFAFLGAYYVMLCCATREGDYRTIARTRVSQGISGPLSQLFLGLLGGGVTGLTFGFIIGQSSGTLLLIKRMVLDRLALLRLVSLRGALQQAWRHRAFPMISSWSNLIDMAGAGQLAYMLVAIYYPGSVAGYMFIAERVVARPLLMLSTSLLTVFMGEIGRTRSTDPRLLRRRFLQVSSRQLLCGALWVGVVDLAALLAFPSIFGRSWQEAVPYLLVLSMTYLANSVIGSVHHTLQVLGHQAAAAIWQVGRVAAIVTVFCAANAGGQDAVHAIAAYTVVQILFCLILFLMMKSSIERLDIPRAPA